ncbi:WecB/TagA/CpsF family glycosyltransferase [Caulobacter sp.]|uniref:WecB/TagA/CpsF family glycosyltransferase n=1 Tax=Caulobacter sp. TaxID=78 RepID=UPI003BAA399D
MLNEWNSESAANQGVSIEGVRINLPTLDTAATAAIRRAEQGEGFTLFTVNLDHLVKLASNDAFRGAYRRATYVTADGWPVVWLAGRKNTQLQRATGADLVEPLCQAAAARDLGVYFVGPGPRAQAGALEKLTQRFEGLRVAGAEAPQLPSGDSAAMLAAMDLDAMAQRINRSDARICFVSLGAPKQEILADALAARCPGVGFICVGAALDFISGEARRAPGWMQRGRLEWFWRLATNPRRLAIRYAECAMLFLALALGATSGQPPSTVAAEPRGVLR